MDASNTELRRLNVKGGLGLMMGGRKGGANEESSDVSVRNVLNISPLTHGMSIVQIYD